MSKEHIKLLVAFVAGAFFGPMVLGMVSSTVGKAGRRAGG